jgi:hypothetical protein
METGTSSASALQARARYRHELRTLTYVTLDQANGGIVRNLTHEGIAVQAVAAVRPKQQLRVRFELRYPRLRVETRGEVVWSTFSGQCGIRFLDLPTRVARQIDEWIFGDLLEGGGLAFNSASPVLIGAADPESKANSFMRGERARGDHFGIAAQPARISSVVADAAQSVAASHRIRKIDEVREVKEAENNEVQEEDEPQFALKLTGDAVTNDGLLVSPAPLKVIQLPASAASVQSSPLINAIATSAASRSASNGSVASARISPILGPMRDQLDWLSQPLTGRSLAWTVDVLIVLASALLGIFVFLSVTREAPEWPLTMATVGTLVVMGLYWGFFKLFGGDSFGARMARLAEDDFEVDRDAGPRFR